MRDGVCVPVRDRLEVLDGLRVEVPDIVFEGVFVRLGVCVDVPDRVRVIVCVGVPVWLGVLVLLPVPVPVLDRV